MEQRERTRARVRRAERLRSGVVAQNVGAGLPGVEMTFRRAAFDVQNTQLPFVLTGYVDPSVDNPACVRARAAIDNRIQFDRAAVKVDDREASVEFALEGWTRRNRLAMRSRKLAVTGRYNQAVTHVRQKVRAGTRCDSADDFSFFDIDESDFVRRPVGNEQERGFFVNGG